MENTIDNARQFLIDSGRRELENIGYGMTGEFIVAPYQMVTYANSVQQPTQREEYVDYYLKEKE